MTQINYGAMSDSELKRYFLNHRSDDGAFHAYMKRRRSRPRSISIAIDDPAWEEKVIAVIQVQLAQHH